MVALSRWLISATLLAVGAALAVGCGGHPSAPASASPAVTASASAGASPAATPIPVRHLTLAADVPFPARLNVVIAWGGYRHGGPGYFAVERYSTNAAGAVRVADLLPAVTGGTGTLMGMAASPDTTWAAVCYGEGCGSEGPAASGVHTVFRISKDGGATWADASDRPGRWAIRGWTNGQAFAVNWDGQTTPYALEPSGAAIVPPVTDAYSPLQFKDELLWTNPSGELLRQGGAVYPPPFAPLPRGFIPQSLAHAGTNVAAGGYLPPSPGVSGPTVTYLFVGRPGTPRPETYYTYGPEPMNPVLWLDATHLLVTADLQRACGQGTNSGASLAIVDLESDSLAFIGKPLIMDGCLKGGPTVVSATQGDFAFVHTAGDCLNVRTEPRLDAPIKACLADGAMLTVVGPSKTTDGRAWLPVTMPNGTAGWAAAEFVTR